MSAPHVFATVAYSKPCFFTLSLKFRNPCVSKEDLLVWNEFLRLTFGPVCFANRLKIEPWLENSELFTQLYKLLTLFTNQSMVCSPTWPSLIWSLSLHYHSNLCHRKLLRISIPLSLLLLVTRSCDRARFSQLYRKSWLGRSAATCRYLQTGGKCVGIGRDFVHCEVLCEGISVDLLSWKRAQEILIGWNRPPNDENSLLK